MIENIKKYVEPYVAIEEPIPYKELLIHPFYVKNYYDFYACINSILIEKNLNADIKIIQMTYLQFLVYVAFENIQHVREKFYILFSKVFNCNPELISFLQDNNGKILLNINGIEISSKEFDEIKKIILYQNMIDYDDKYVDPEVKKAMEEFYEVRNKGIKIPELNDKISIISSVCGIQKKDLLDYTLYDFDLLFSNCKNLIDYKVERTAELSGNVKFDKKVEHWIYHKAFNPYEEAFTSYDGFKEKIQNE